MIRGIGIDAAEVARIENSMESEAFHVRVFTQHETDYIVKKGAAGAESAAACFAAKEAALKALGTGIGPLSLTDIWVEHDESGRPSLGFSEKAKKAASAIGAERAHLSITHAGGLAIASVILEDDRQEKFEKLYSDLRETQSRTEAELSSLQSNGRAKSLRARELTAKKLTDGSTLRLFRSYGL